MNEAVSSAFNTLRAYFSRKFRDEEDVLGPLLGELDNWSQKLNFLENQLSNSCLNALINRALADRRCNRNYIKKEIESAIDTVREEHRAIAIQILEGSLYQRQRRVRKCSGQHHKRFVLNLLKSNPFIYLDELQDRIQRKFRITISISTVYLRVKEWGFTLKKATAASIAGLSTRNLLRRREFVNTYFQNANENHVGTTRESSNQTQWTTTEYIHLPPQDIARRQVRNLQNANPISLPINADHFFFVDETGVNARTSIRARGRSKKGTPCITKQRYRKGSRHISAVIACSRTAGVLSHRTKQGGYKRVDFISFLKEQLIPAIVQERRRLKDLYLQQHELHHLNDWHRQYHRWMRSRQHKDVAFLVMDNASIHKGDSVIQAVHDTLNDLHIHDVLVKIVYQPPYAPTMHPTEMINAQMKSRLRRYTSQYLPSRQVERQLMQDIDTALLFVTPQNVRGYYNHCGWR